MTEARRDWRQGQDPDIGNVADLDVLNCRIFFGFKHNNLFTVRLSCNKVPNGSERKSYNPFNTSLRDPI